MTSPFDGYEVEAPLRPSARTCEFDLDQALSAVVALESRVSADAFSARSLGRERLGNGAVIGPDGLVLTIGYLVTEAEEVTLTTNDGRRIAAHVLGSDTATGLALVHALEPLDLPTLPLGDSRKLQTGARVILAGAGGRAHASAGMVTGRGPFAGYWEYLLDDAIITAPAHPHWSGAALLGPSGELMGVGSLTMQQESHDGEVSSANMFVPSELLPPILDDLAKGRTRQPARPWLGVLAREIDSHVIIMGVTPGGPASRAELRAGDAILAVAGTPVSTLAEFYTQLWACGAAGTSIPMRVQRERDVFGLEVRSADRASRLKRRRLN